VKRLLVLAAFLALAVPASAARLPILASHDWWPVWSPDMRWIAFTRVNGQGTVFSLEVAPAGGGRIRQVAQARSQLLPSWSADSSHLAYQSGGRIYTIARDGTDRTPVAVGLYPDWSSTGAVAYVHNGDLWVAGRVLASGVIAKPDWSPDGSEIAFTRSDGIYAVTLTGRIRVVASATSEPGGPSWTLDGKQIAYTDGHSVFGVPGDGSSPPARVAGPYATLSTPGWSQFGDALAYTADGHVDVTWLTSPPRTDIGRPAGVGAAFAPGDLNGYRLAVSVPVPGCPGHTGIDSGTRVSGTCTIVGTRAGDVIYGTTAGGDVIDGLAGNDRIHAADHHADRLDCGVGRDTVWADRTDTLLHCEVVHR
jgi:dipeptidyl aminopeptidase/acylaminoacyl peptidase